MYMGTLPKIELILFPVVCSKVRKYSILPLDSWDSAEGQRANACMAKHIHSAQKYADY